MKESFNPIISLEGQTEIKSVAEVRQLLDKNGFICAWMGCQSSHKGQLPPGWRMIAVFKDDTDYDSIFNGEIDGRLCPLHVKELGEYLKIGYTLSVAAAEANRTGN